MPVSCKCLDSPGDKGLRVLLKSERHMYTALSSHMRAAFESGFYLTSRSSDRQQIRNHNEANDIGEWMERRSKLTLGPSSSHILPDKTWGEDAADGVPVESGKWGPKGARTLTIRCGWIIVFALGSDLVLFKSSTAHHPGEEMWKFYEQPQAWIQQS